MLLSDKSRDVSWEHPYQRVDMGWRCDGLIYIKVSPSSFSIWLLSSHRCLVFAGRLRGMLASQHDAYSSIDLNSLRDGKIHVPRRSKMNHYLNMLWLPCHQTGDRRADGRHTHGVVFYQPSYWRNIYCTRGPWLPDSRRHLVNSLCVNDSWYYNSLLLISFYTTCLGTNPVWVCVHSPRMVWAQPTCAPWDLGCL